MRTYLLEKTRVVFQAPEERNYHIFYQLCAARQSLPHLHLGNETFTIKIVDYQKKFHNFLLLEDQNYFNYLNQGDCPYIEGVNDLETYEDTTNAFTTLGFSDSEKNDIFKTLSGILHLGNITFEDTIISIENEQDQEGCLITVNRPNNSF